MLPAGWRCSSRDWVGGVVLAAVVVVVVVGRHSGATGSPSNLPVHSAGVSQILVYHLLQLMTRCDPSVVDTALMALRLIWLWVTWTTLVYCTVLYSHRSNSHRRLKKIDHIN